MSNKTAESMNERLVSCFPCCLSSCCCAHDASLSVVRLSSLSCSPARSRERMVAQLKHNASARTCDGSDVLVQAAAEAKRTAEQEKQLEKVRQMNSRVSEAEKKRGEEAPHDFTPKAAKIQSAEEKKAALLKETQEKAAAEVAKVLRSLTCLFLVALRPLAVSVFCTHSPPPRMVLLPQAKELAEKKAQKLQEMDENLKAKMTAAEERRQKLISGLFRARALSAQSAVNIAAVPEHCS